MNATWELAVRGGDVQAVREMLGAGSEVNTRDRHGQTALMLAAHHGYRELISRCRHLDADILIA